MDTDPHPQDLQSTPHKIIVSATPVVAIIVSPDWSATIPVSLPMNLSQTLRRRYEQMNSDHTRYGFRHHDFGEWLAGILSDFAFGHGEDPGSVQDWLERGD